MSQQRISHSGDLKRLRDEGYDVGLQAGHVLVRDVPYLNAAKQIGRGVLVSKLELAGDTTAKPKDHVAMFVGEHPCTTEGLPIPGIKHSSNRQQLDENLWVDHMFSTKPTHGRGYADYHDKMTTYVRCISDPARAHEPDVTAQTYPAIEACEEESPFHYWDTASSRAEIVAISRKLEIGSVAIVGTGGTGSYVLDFVAKTPVKTIHIFDGDTFSQHNAFRAPGAASLEQLQAKPQKVAYLEGVYSKLHRGILAHDLFMDAESVDALKECDFVFVCMDQNATKAVVVERLLGWGVPFIDVGMGIEKGDDALLGLLRTTTCTAAKHDHVAKRIAIQPVDHVDEYDRNIQVCELNALNAALAVIRWKKYVGFYHDQQQEHNSVFVLSQNEMINEDLP